MTTHQQYLDEAFDLARTSMHTNIGGPFGAVVVKDGVIIGRGGNEVIYQTDPTAHAEIVAIRNACLETKLFDLTGAVIYSTCEPCPMCLAAIYWAGIKEVYYVLTSNQAEAAGFRDRELYDEFNLPPEKRSVALVRKEFQQAEAIFDEWKLKTDKLVY